MLLDRPATPAFDRVTTLAAHLLEAPIALLTLVDEDRQFFLSSWGLPEPLATERQTPLDYSLCQHAVAAGRPLIVGDALADPVLSTNRTVVELGIRAYAGIPLITPDSHAVGTVCVLDFVTRDWPDDRITLLGHLADIAMDEVRLHFYDRLAARKRQWRGVGSWAGRHRD
jgi:GAF domain-containing protein